MKRLIQPQHADNRRAGGPGGLAVFCLAALLSAITVGCGGSSSGGTLAYVSNSTGTGFTVFKVNSNGTLTTASISPQNTTSPPKVLQISPDGRWAFFLDAAGQNIFGFRRAGNGSFSSAISGTPFPVSGGSSLAISSNSQFLYVALPNALDGELEMFHIDQGNGELSHISGGGILRVGYQISQLLMSPDGAVLYGLAPAQQTVVTFTLNSSNGLATVADKRTVGPTPPCFDDPAATGCGGMILSANGNFLYVVDLLATGAYPSDADQSPNIYGFTTSSTGILSTMAGSPFHENADLITQAFPTNPVAGATSNDSRLLFIANRGTHNISVFRIATTTGEPTEVTGSVSGGISSASPFDCGPGCSTPTFVAVSKNNNAVYALDTAAAKIFQSSVDQNTGRLRSLNPASVDLPVGSTPVWITIR